MGNNHCCSAAQNDPQEELNCSRQSKDISSSLVSGLDYTFPNQGVYFRLNRNEGSVIHNDRSASISVKTTRAPRIFMMNREDPDHFDFTLPHPCLGVIPTLKPLLDKHPLKEGGRVAIADLILEEYEEEDKILKYFGQSVGGVGHGKGQFYVLPNNDLWAGDFEEGSPHGSCQIYFGNGEYFEGILNKGFLQKGSFYYKNGEVYEGTFKKNKRHGEGLVTLPDGTKKKCLYSDGILCDKNAVSPSSDYKSNDSISFSSKSPISPNMISSFLSGSPNNSKGL